MAVSMKFNHQKVILNTALGNDVLYGRHANMQVPTFVGKELTHPPQSNISP